MKLGETNSSTSKRFFGDALIIALITAFGYFITSIVENSHLAYFGISPNNSLVSPSVTEIISVTVAMCTFGIFCMFISKPIYKIIAPKTESKENIKYHFLSIFLGYFIPFAFLKIILLGHLSWAMLLEWGTFIVAALVGMEITHYSLKHNQKDKKHLDIFFLESHILGFMEEDLSINGILFSIVLGLAMVLALAPSVGTSVAATAKIYNVINANPPLVVVAQYGDILIAEPFDENSKQIVNEAHLINVNSLEERGLYMSGKSVGPFEPTLRDKDNWEKILDWIILRLRQFRGESKG